MRVRLHHALLLGILFLAAALRLFALADVPSGFFTDEAAAGLNAQALVEHGTSRTGVPHPLFFPEFGTHFSPFSIYSIVPFVALLGMTEFAVRLPNALWGVLAVFLTYLLALRLFAKHPQAKNIALVAALFLAISPWHVHLSRVAFDSWPAFVVLVLAGTLFFFHATTNPRLLPASVALFGLSLYTYFPTRIFTPLFGLGLFLLHWRVFLKHRRAVLASVVTLLLVLTPFLYFTFTDPNSMGRWKQAGIFPNPPNDGAITTHILSNYFSHFSAEFLFIKGDAGMPGQGITRHSVLGIGELYWFQLPLLLIGLYALWQRKYRTVFWTLGLWLLLYPLGSAITTAQAAQATRSIIGVIPFQIIAAFGLIVLLACIPKKHMRRAAAIAVAVIAILSAAQFAHAYYVEYPRHSWNFWGWQYGAQEVVEMFIAYESQYDDLVLYPEFNGPEMLIPFYTQNGARGCAKCRTGSFDQFDPKKRQLIAIPPHKLAESKYNASFTARNRVLAPDGSVAFVLGELKNSS